MTDIPLATILRINAARTIPLTRYEEEGTFDRFGSIKDLAENHGADLPAAIAIADLLGQEDGFDGLVTTIVAATEGFEFGSLICGGGWNRAWSICTTRRDRLIAPTANLPQPS